MMGAPILIMAGGTGGHIFPALAVAQALRGRNEEVIWLGTRRGLEAELVPRAGIPLEWVRVSGLRGKGALAWLLAPFRLAVAVYDALGVLIRHRPKVVLGMGGFASGPGGFAAWLLRRPLIIHEQNSVAGLTNRLLAGMAREVLEAFPGSFSADVRTRLTGNPVRPEIVALPSPEQRLSQHGERLRVLVLGGSLGAKVLNEIVPRALAKIPAAKRPEVRHQAGETTYDLALSAYEEEQVAAQVDRFIEDIAAAYGWADLVICRSGALTVSELAAAGLGSVLVPYPAAVDDHQTTNAAFLEAAGAAVLIQQEQLNPDVLAAEILRCIEDRELVMDRAVRARKLARPDAASEVAERCIVLGHRA
jgi:UDP-N-acetylglucosamine--N-acetylmuramyl-(pentapeptide) pyrophosphoryl-undecaprenol N-acetylglucosamine transferase